MTLDPGSSAGSNSALRSSTLHGKAALIIGGSRGIGESIVRAFHASGAQIMIGSRNVRELEALARELDPTGSKVRYIQVDMTKSKEVEKAVAETVAAFGKLDVAVNNAGTQIPRIDFTETTEEQFDQVVNLNLRGVFLAMKHELGVMGRGSVILNMTSVAGLVGLPRIAPYVASKHGVIGLTKVAALEYAERGIRVNALAPGTVMAGMFKAGPASSPETLAPILAHVPMRKIADPEEVAAAAVWLCSDASSYVTGVTLPVDGGYVAN